jgi:hypothetical protein
MLWNRRLQSCWESNPTNPPCIQTLGTNSTQIKLFLFGHQKHPNKDLRQLSFKLLGRAKSCKHSDIKGQQPLRHLASLLDQIHRKQHPLLLNGAHTTSPSFLANISTFFVNICLKAPGRCVCLDPSCDFEGPSGIQNPFYCSALKNVAQPNGSTSTAFWALLFQILTTGFRIWEVSIRA